MKQEIKELVKQCYNERLIEAKGINVFVEVFDNEKYTELILQECFNYLTKEAERLYALKNEDADMCAEKCYDNILGLKEHFGIEV